MGRESLQVTGLVASLLMGTAAFTAANAAQIIGEFNMSSVGASLVSPAGGSTTLEMATGLDFTNDQFEVDDPVTGDFATFLTMGDLGTIVDFTFSPFAPVASLWSVGGFSFDAGTMAIIAQVEGFLALEATGVVSGNGFDDTPGLWRFTTQGDNGGGISEFSFSATQSAAPTEVPEPAALALLGTGLLGIGLFRRRRA